MNNIQKAFKQKAKMGLRMAAGGVVPFGTLTNSDGSVSADSMEHPLNKLSMVDKNALGLDISAAGQSDMAARLDAQQNLFAASNNGRTSNVFAGIDMQPTQGLQATPAQPTIEQDVAARGKRIAGLKDKLRALGSPGYKEGGMVQDFTGKGRPDKDTVPAMLAHGEAVLPAKTVASLGGPEAIEELIESTNGKPSATAQQKKGLRGGVLHAYTGFPGDTVDPRELRPEFRSQAQTPVIEPASSNAAEVNRNSRAAINMNRAANAPGVSEAQAARAAASGEAATAASQASSQAAKQGFLRRALGTVGRMIVNPATVAAGTAYAGFKAPQWLDSIPDLRGKATAASTDMTLAGTPQHDEEVQKELIAKDDEWEREHNQSLGEQHARGSSNFDVKPAATATEAELARNDPAPGLVGMPTPKTLNDGTKVFTGMSKQDATQMQAPVGGGYITGQPDANGLRKAIFMPGEQTPYTGADGKPTTDWTKTQAYSEGVARANKDKALLAEMQRDRVTRDAFDPTIRDPKVHALAQQQLAQMNQRDAVMGEQGLRKQMVELQGKHFDEISRHNRALEEATAAGIRRQLEQQGVQDMDQLIAGAGFEGKEANAFRDFFRQNFAGRRQRINGKDVDVPGFEDMKPDERRHYMPEAMAKYKIMNTFNDKRLAGSGGSSNSVPEKVRTRDMTLDDVARSPNTVLGWMGVPQLYSDNPNDPGLFGEGSYFSRHWNPASDYGKKIIEEVGVDGKGLRKVFAGSLRNGDYGPYGSRDVMQWVKEHEVK